MTPFQWILVCAIAMLAGGLQGMVVADDDTSTPDVAEPLNIALDASRRCAVGYFAEPTGKWRLCMQPRSLCLHS